MNAAMETSDRSLAESIDGVRDCSCHLTREFNELENLGEDPKIWYDVIG